ncbi:MAG: hypothetical protein Q8867_08415 [Bacteroidota bacterium]|nr:hypothetical protein [Bacteroidota bacterium]
MKKVVVLVSALFLFSTLTFAQTPQTQTKEKAAPAKKEVKDTKAGCDKKDGKKCCKMDKKAGCCKDKAKAEKKTETTPEKK